MISNEHQEILKIISEAQHKQTAPVELQLGRTSSDNHVIEGVFIRDCPARIIEALIKAGWVLSMDEGFLHPIYKRSDD